MLDTLAYLSNKNLEDLVNCKAVQVFHLHDTNTTFFAHGIYVHSMPETVACMILPVDQPNGKPPTSSNLVYS